MANIYIVEDDQNILEIESYALCGNGYETAGFENAQLFFAALSGQGLPDLVLLDIMLPDMDGLTVLKKIRTNPTTRHLPVIMVTAKSTEIDTVRGLDLGADDYITKPFGLMELLSRVKALLRRTEPPEAEEIYTLGAISLNVTRRTCFTDGNTVDLTYKEFELLTLLLRNQGIVLRRDTLMNEIWGINFEGESRTLDMHIKTLRQKLGTSSEHIQTVRNVGYTAR